MALKNCILIVYNHCVSDLSSFRIIYLHHSNSFSSTKLSARITKLPTWRCTIEFAFFFLNRREDGLVVSLQTPVSGTVNISLVNIWIKLFIVSGGIEPPMRWGFINHHATLWPQRRWRGFSCSSSRQIGLNHSRLQTPVLGWAGLAISCRRLSEGTIPPLIWLVWYRGELTAVDLLRRRKRGHIPHKAGRVVFHRPVWGVGPVPVVCLRLHEEIGGQHHSRSSSDSPAVVAVLPRSNTILRYQT